MIEIRGNFDESNTSLKFRCVIFCSDLFHRTSSDRDLF